MDWNQRRSSLIMVIIHGNIYQDSTLAEDTPSTRVVLRSWVCEGDMMSHITSRTVKSLLAFPMVVFQVIFLRWYMCWGCYSKMIGFCHDFLHVFWVNPPFFMLFPQQKEGHEIFPSARTSQQKVFVEIPSFGTSTLRLTVPWRPMVEVFKFDDLGCARWSWKM